ncbi:helix-turn-helix transcriptional regulator [Streptomyces olivoreticuli]|uniref:helix-turn-helix transcriptional regulator n=1 Tax=Streptomyces olivoreticuli TaxID=68246 RepID=UPI0013C2AD0D|nr:helix-turn-helix transcriptional regulator [Streptomyces olivoreticuli]
MLSAIGLDAVRETGRCGQPTQRLAGNSAVELVTGSHAIAERLLRLRLAATREICTLMADRSWPIAGDAVNGVPQRVVVDRSAPARAVVLAPGSGHGGSAARVRAVGRVPAEFVVADRAVALVPLSRHAAGPAAPAALVVRPGALLTSLADLFEDVWHQALPLRTGVDGALYEIPGAGPDTVDLEVLSLLLAGLTDASVAKQLGLGLRTVQRRVKRMMELAGVTTRLQLGWHAAERGWTARR